MSDVNLRVQSKRFSEKWQTLMERFEAETGEPSAERAATEVLQEFTKDPGSLQYELVSRTFLLDPIVRVTDSTTGRFCLIPAGDEPTKIESPGRKKYLYMVEVNVMQPVEVEAEDELAAHDEAFAQLESLQLGECEEMTLSFHNILDDPEGGFSPN